MDVTIVALTVFALLVLFLGSTIWVGISLILVGISSLLLFTATSPFGVLSNIVWNNVNSLTMFALPMFIFMGEILFRSRMASDLFRGLAPWMSLLPGRLVHVNVMGSSLFAAVSGSSAATTATVGRIALPELKKRNYSESLSIGMLAGAGTLGFLIPPSLMMIVYGIAANVSIGQLFIAGIIPGAMLAIGFSTYAMLRGIINPDLTPKGEDYTWGDRFKSLPLFLPVVFLVVMVLGSIYAGWATPTEAAAVGVLGALLFAFLSRSMNFKSFWQAVMGAIKTNAMIMLIVIAASYLSVAIGYLRLPAMLTEFIGSLGLSPYQLILILAIMYIILGTMLDGFSMVLLSLPLALPLVTAAGFDPLWFGIFLIIMIEIAQITPPIGFNLFVINGLTGVDVLRIAVYALPSFLIILVIAAILTIYPEIVLWLPELMIGS